MRLYAAEFKKYWSELINYYPDQIVSLVVTYIVFFAFFYGFGSSTDASYYIGYLYWYFGSSVISESAVTISSEKQEGTLEQLLIKPVNIGMIAIARTLVWLTVHMLKVVILLILLKVTLDIPLGFNFFVLPVFVITLIGLLGFTLILTALTLQFTKTASFDSIISYTLLFFTGSLISLDKMPHFIRDISQFFPLTQGISMSRAYIDGTMPGMSDWCLLFVNSGIYFIFGLLFFSFILAMFKNYVDICLLRTFVL